MFGWLKSTHLMLEHSGWGLWWRHATNGWIEVEPLGTAGTQQHYGIQREIVWGMGVQWRRGFMTAAALWEEQHPPHPAPPLWIIHLLSLSLWPPRRALISSRSPFLPPALLFSFSTSHSLFLCHTLCTPLALLPWQPWVKSQHVEKRRWGFWLCVSGKERWGLHHYCVWSSMRLFFFWCRCKVAGRDLDHIILSVFFFLDHCCGETGVRLSRLPMGAHPCQLPACHCGDIGLVWDSPV